GLRELSVPLPVDLTQHRAAAPREPQGPHALPHLVRGAELHKPHTRRRRLDLRRFASHAGGSIAHAPRRCQAFSRAPPFAVAPFTLALPCPGWRAPPLCPSPAGTVLWQSQTGSYTLSVCVRGTFSLTHGREAALAGAQEPVTADRHHADDPRASLLV